MNFMEVLPTQNVYPRNHQNTSRIGVQLTVTLFGTDKHEDRTQVKKRAVQGGRSQRQFRQA